MSYFTHAQAAQRYAAARPYFHPVVLEHLYRHIGDVRFDRALDVACGTGQSMSMLSSAARSVVGVDRSTNMLTLAPTNGQSHRVLAVAEALPFADASFDLMTVALAFHWFDRNQFLAEAARVLRPGAWVVIYNNSFHGRMRGNAGFERWFHDCYLTRFPTPPRDRKPFTDDDAHSFGFEFDGREEYANEVVFTVPELVTYLTTQSNVIASVEEGDETTESVSAWLMSELSSQITEERGVFLFGGPIWYLRRHF